MPLSTMIWSMYCALAFVTVSVLAENRAQTINISSRRLTATDPRKSRRQNLSPANLALQDFYRGTDLQWFGNITVGTPPQTVTVVFDTGSATLEFASTLCGSACVNQIKFDPSQSSTFVDTEQTNSISFGTGVGVDPVVNNDYVLYLRSGQDTVALGNLVVANTDLWLITDQTATFSIDPFSGIMGMSSQAGGFFTGLIQQGLPSLFSLYLTPMSLGNAELTIGGIDQSKFQGSPIYAPLHNEQSDGTWLLASSGISVNGQTTDVLNAQRIIIFDSGTSNVVFSQRTAEAIYAIISPNIKPYTAETGTYGLPCNEIPALPAAISITFTDTNGNPFNLTIPSSELSVGPFTNDPSTCQMLINADDFDIIGGSLLKHYYSVWDVGSQRLGFAPI